MSGSRAITLQLSVRDADVVRKQLEAMGEAGEKALARLDAAAKRAADAGGLGGVAGAAGNASTSMGRFNQVIQQGGYQLGDFAVQVQGGTSALTALSQQGSQFLGMFGPMGAVAGVVLTVGTIAAKFLDTASAATEAKQKGQEALDAMAKSGADTARVLASINDLFLTATQRAANLANAQRTALREQAQSRLSDVSAGRQELARRLAEEESYLRDVQAPAKGPYYRAESDEDRNLQAQAIVRVRELRSQLAAADREADTLRQSLDRLSKAGQVGAEEYGPTSADPFGTGALRASLDDKYAAQQAYQAKLNEINQQAREGHLSAAEASQLAAKALDQYNESISRLGKTASTALPAAQRDADSLQKSWDKFWDDADKRSEERAGKEAKQREDASRKAQEKIDREAEQAQQKAIRQAEAATDRVSQYLGDTLADALLDTEGNWSKTWKSMERFALSTILRIAAEAVITPIVRPIFYGLNGVSTMGAMTSGGSSLSGLSDGFSLTGALKGAGGLYDAVTGASATSGYLNSFNNWAAGSGWFTPASGAASLGTPAAGGSAFALDMSGGAAQSAMNQANPAFFGTASGTIAGTAGILAGGYGIYSGFERGGPGGYTQAAAGGASILAGAGTLASAGGTVGTTLAGAAPWLAAAGPYAAVAAAVLAIASMFLPGQKPSDKTGTYALNLISGEGEFGGLTGDRFSQENRDAAKSLADQLKTISDSLVSALGTDKPGKIFQTTAGDRDGIKLLLDGITRTYDRSEEGSQQLIKDFTSSIIEALRYGEGVTPDEMRIVDLAGGNLDTIMSNLDWLHNVFEPMGTAAEQTNTLQVALDNLAATYDPVIKKAEELGLSTEGLTTQLGKASDALRAQVVSGFWQADRAAQGRDYINQVEALRASSNATWGAYATAGMDPARLFWDQLRSTFSQLTTSQLQDVAVSFRGADDAAADLAEEMLRLGQSTDALAAAQSAAQQAAQEAEAAAREQAARRENATASASGVVVSLADYARGLSYGSESPLSLRSQYSQAQREFQMAADRALAGDASSLSGLQDYAETFRSTARSLYGSTTGYSQALSEIQGVLSRVGNASAEALTQTFMAAEMETQTTRLEAASDRLLAQLAALRREMQQLVMKQAA